MSFMYLCLLLPFCFISVYSVSCKKQCICVNYTRKIDISYDVVDTFSTQCTSYDLIGVFKYT